MLWFYCRKLKRKRGVFQIVSICTTDKYAKFKTTMYDLGQDYSVEILCTTQQVYSIEVYKQNYAIWNRAKDIFSHLTQNSRPSAPRKITLV